MSGPPPADTIRVGVVGCGIIAYWTHLRELKRLPGARLVAAADPDAAARRRASELAGIPTHAEASELLARPDIDAVVICTPAAHHAALAAEAARAAKHIYLEKPVATSAADALQMAGVIRAFGVRLAVGFNRRSHPVYRQARQLIAAGALGDIRAIQSSNNEPVAEDSMPAWRHTRSTGGGALLDLASHHVDLLRWFLNDEAVEVEAQIHSRNTEHDEAWTRITMRQGVQAQGYFSFRAGRADFLEFIGEHGTLRLDRHNPSLCLKLKRRFGYGVRNAPVRPNLESLALRIKRLVRPSYDSSYRVALADFVASIHGREPHGATLDDGLRSLSIILAAEESARTLHSVSIPAEPI